MTRDLRTLIYLLNLELREECSRALGHGPGYAIGEQQSKRTQSGEQQFKRTQSGSSSRRDAIGRRAAAEAGAIGEQQLDARRRQTGSASSSGSGCRNWAREQQLKRTQAASSS